MVSKSNLREDLKLKLLKRINLHYQIKIEPRKFKIISIKTGKNSRTEYPGYPLELDQNKPITLVKGETATGKTMTYDKITHFFLRWDKQKSRIKDLTTEIELIIEEIKSRILYKILFHSQSGLEEGQRFQVFEIKGKEELKLQGSDLFLKESLLINNQLNASMFIPESPRFSFVDIYCASEDQFRSLFRNPILNVILQDLINEIRTLENDEKNFKDIAKGNELEINYLTRETERQRISLKMLEFFDNNREELLRARTVFDQFDQQTQHSTKNLIKELRSFKQKVNDIDSKIQEIEQFDLKNSKDIIDLFRGLESRICWRCDTVIPPSPFRTRVKESKCYVCGIGKNDYSEELKKIPGDDIPNLISQKDELQKQKRELKEKINEINKQIQKIIPKPIDVDIKVWNRIKTTDKDELSKLISDSLEQIPEIMNVIKTYQKTVENWQQKNENTEKQCLQISNQIIILKKFIEEITSQEKEIYERLKTEILDECNIVLMMISDEKAGQLYYNGNGALCLKTSILSENESGETIEREHLYKESKYELSPGQLRKIDFAFIFSLLKLTYNYEFRPLNLLVIDSLNFLDRKGSQFILEGLAKIDGLKTILFEVDEIDFISKDFYQTIPISRNPLVITPDGITVPKEQLTLDRWFISKK